MSIKLIKNHLCQLLIGIKFAHSGVYERKMKKFSSSQKLKLNYANASQKSCQLGQIWGKTNAISRLGWV